MGLKKKKNIIILTLCMVISFIVYQLYFFFTITSETGADGSGRIQSVMDHAEVIMHLRSEADKYINENGVIRGVYYSNMKQYRPTSNNEFKCIKSEQHIPFDLINDDYCDCEDGTDEPSTTACVNGTFYCDSQYQRAVSLHQIPSGKVNDGICDCCDGSDEWLHGIKKVLSQSTSKLYRYYVTECPNNCR